MMSRNACVILALCLAGALLVIGCTQPAATGTPTPVQPVSQTPAVQPSMANPASVSCGTMDGTTEIRKNTDGSEYGMCSFANGTSCEEWALYRGEGCKPEQVTNTSARAGSGLANPASVNCGKMNGTTEIKKKVDGSEYGMCSFANGTSCEEWALFRGEGCNAGNATTPSK